MAQMTKASQDAIHRLNTKINIELTDREAEAVITALSGFLGSAYASKLDVRAVGRVVDQIKSQQ
jgi:hypothetical protein